jgi:hypothetical protein
MGDDTRPSYYIPSTGDEVEVTVRGTVSAYSAGNRVLWVRPPNGGRPRPFYLDARAMVHDDSVTVRKVEPAVIT